MIITFRQLLRISGALGLTLAAATAVPSARGDGLVVVKGELKQWHKATLDLAGGAAVSLAAPDFEDWLAVVRPAHSSLAVGATPESVVRGFGDKLYVTLMGTGRKSGDGDGKVVVVDGDQVSDFATGVDDPKGIVFVGGRRIFVTDMGETANDLNPQDPADRNRVGPDGYTMLERYLHGLTLS